MPISEKMPIAANSPTPQPSGAIGTRTRQHIQRGGRGESDWVRLHSDTDGDAANQQHLKRLLQECQHEIDCKSPSIAPELGASGGEIMQEFHRSQMHEAAEVAKYECMHPSAEQAGEQQVGDKTGQERRADPEPSLRRHQGDREHGTAENGPVHGRDAARESARPPATPPPEWPNSAVPHHPPGAQDVPADVAGHERAGEVGLIEDRNQLRASAWRHRRCAATTPICRPSAGGRRWKSGGAARSGAAPDRVVRRPAAAGR